VANFGDTGLVRDLVALGLGAKVEAGFSLSFSLAATMLPGLYELKENGSGTVNGRLETLLLTGPLILGI
jgi:hypothetical protein